MGREAEVRVVDPQLTALRIKGDLQETTHVRSDLAPGKEAQLVREKHRAILRAGQRLLRAGVRCLEYQRHRRHQVEQQALLALGVLALEGLTPPEHVAVELEGPPRGCELREMGMAGAAREARLACVGWRDVRDSVAHGVDPQRPRPVFSLTASGITGGEGSACGGRDEAADQEDEPGSTPPRHSPSES